MKNKIELLNTEELEWKSTPFSGIFYKFMVIDSQGGRILDLLKVEKDHEVKPHTHKIPQMSYLISGTALGWDESNQDFSIELPAGTFSNIPSGEMHGFKAVEECIWHDYFGGGKLDIDQHNGNVYLLSQDGSFEKI